MRRTEIHTNVPAAQVALLVALAEMGGGKLVPPPEEEEDGEFTLTFSFPAPADSNEIAAAAAAATPVDATSQAAAAVTAEPAWLRIARGELGESEVAGVADNARIRQYHAATRGREAPDSVPWCSSFVNFCMQHSGVKGTGSKRARSWAEWGRAAPDGALAPGTVVVLSRGAPPKGHVGLLVGTDGDRLLVLGGNQSDRVSIAAFPAHAVVALREPTPDMLLAAAG